MKGSTRAARCAGTIIAINATALRPTEKIAKINGLVVLTSYSKLFKSRVRAKAPAMPIMRPAPTGIEPCRITRPMKREIHQCARVEAVSPQRTMGFTLRTVIRTVTIGIGKLFRIPLDRASKAV
jgi:hypothetical protein